MQDVVIAGYLRTAQSRSRPNAPEKDWFHQLRADDLLSKLLPELLRRSDVDPREVDDCITGCSIAVSENWTYGGRFPVFLANFPQTVAAKTVDQQCGSSMAAAHIGAMEVMVGAADVVLAAGMEHMTRVPRGQAMLPHGHVKMNQRLVPGGAIRALGHPQFHEHGPDRREAFRHERFSPPGSGPMGPALPLPGRQGAGRRLFAGRNNAPGGRSGWRE